jgi:Protein of unknown function (DUF3318)
MDLQANHSTQESEIQRLKTILPIELQSQVCFIEAQGSHTDLIETKRTVQHQCLIQLDFKRWQRLDLDQRNLLFWHEISRIQGLGISQSSPEKIVLSIGLLVFCIEMISQNLLGISTTLAVLGLASHQLYQKNWGERSLRAKVVADRSAIQLATEFGYSVPEAYNSLYSALRILAQKKSEKLHWRTYQVRLNVLDIFNGQIDLPLEH